MNLVKRVKTDDYNKPVVINLLNMLKMRECGLVNPIEFKQTITKIENSPENIDVVNIIKEIAIYIKGADNKINDIDKTMLAISTNSFHNMWPYIRYYSQEDAESILLQASRKGDVIARSYCLICNIGYEHQYKYTAYNIVENENVRYPNDKDILFFLGWLNYCKVDRFNENSFGLAVYYLKQAAELGNIRAYLFLSKIYYDKQYRSEEELKLASEYCKMGAIKGDKMCMYHMGNIYEKDKKIAKEWLRKAEVLEHDCQNYIMKRLNMF